MRPKQPRPRSSDCRLWYRSVRTLSLPSLHGGPGAEIGLLDDPLRYLLYICKYIFQRVANPTGSSRTAGERRGERRATIAFIEAMVSADSTGCVHRLSSTNCSQPAHHLLTTCTPPAHNLHTTCYYVPYLDKSLYTIFQ